MKVLKPILISIFVFLFFLLFGCVKKSDMERPVEKNETVETNVDWVMTHKNSHDEMNSTEHITQGEYDSVTVQINDTPVTFEAYKIDEELFFSISDLRDALYYTQARFWFDNTPDAWQSDDSLYGISTHIINGVRYAALHDIAPQVGFEIVSAPNQEIIIGTNEPHISEAEQQAIADFLFTNYPQIFKFERVWRYFGEDSGSWFAYSFRLFDMDGSTPGIAVRYGDAGSHLNTAYMFINGEYRETSAPAVRYRSDRGLLVWRGSDGYLTYIGGEIQSVPDVNEDTLTVEYERTLYALHRQVESSVNQKLWPALVTLADGTVVDANLCDELIELIVNFISDIDSVLFINEIKESLISDDLLLVTTTNSHNFIDRHWIQLRNNEDSWEILSFFENYMWWDD